MSQDFSPGFSGNRRLPTGTSYLSNERFWLEEPISLFRSATLIPQCGMTTAVRLNALTRLILLITLILYLFCVGQWWLFLLLGLLLVIVLYFLDQQTLNQYNIVENYICPSRQIRPLKNNGRIFNPNQQYPVSVSPRVVGFQPYI